MTKPERRYAIISPAYNESRYIAETIRSVLVQSVLPVIWVIVDDGSTDGTADIIKTHASDNDFIRYCYREKPAGQAYFSSNVFAIMAGYEEIKNEEFNFLAILDADITLPPDYYELLLRHFASDDRLGVASGIYENLIDGRLESVLNDRRSTPKAIQVFKREVFEQIGGFLPLPYGGEDTISCVMARMNGWKAWSFPDIKTIHLRPTGTGAVNVIWKARFRQGRCEYDLGTHPLFFCLKMIKRAVSERPYLLGSFLRIAGYIWGAASREPLPVSSEIKAYVRKEQLHRVFRLNKIS